MAGIKSKTSGTIVQTDVDSCRFGRNVGIIAGAAVLGSPKKAFRRVQRIIAQSAAQGEVVNQARTQEGLSTATAQDIQAKQQPRTKLMPTLRLGQDASAKKGG
jgi:hypothetical protein